MTWQVIKNSPLSFGALDDIVIKQLKDMIKVRITFHKYEEWFFEIGSLYKRKEVNGDDKDGWKDDKEDEIPGMFGCMLIRIVSRHFVLKISNCQ